MVEKDIEVAEKKIVMAEKGIKMAEILKNLGSKVLEEIASAWGFEDQLEKLKNTTNTIKDVLLDVEEKQVESHAVRGWLERLRAVVFEVDELFDEFTTVASPKGGEADSKDGAEFAFRLDWDEDQAGCWKREKTYSFIDVEKVIGIDDDKKAVMDMILDSSVVENVSVISVVCIGGLDMFDIKLIIEKILMSVTDVKLQNLEIEQLQSQL
ncbi:hypothetical protein Nepgr_026482 [Nepenthes gracilis]|uniref:Disease resistance N-terminal domain-containing protein n=1 Tax=Nepenthes gracilis TaxID=150966 RepID=A0AAD3T8I2_NEPGR|nr:hypothetical protein Nepgr_026482 [Nepenthes gracilis]